MSRFHEIISRFHEIICCFHHETVCQLTLNLWQKQWYIQDSRQSFLQNMISCLPDNIQFSRDTISISRDIMMISNSRDSISFLKVIFLSIFFENRIVYHIRNLHFYVQTKGRSPCYCFFSIQYVSYYWFNNSYCVCLGSP